LSIIYDALKKVEKNVDKGTSDNEETKTKDTNKPKPILIYILVILLGLYAGNFVFKFWTKSKTKAMPPAILESVAPASKIATPVHIEKPALRLSELVKTPEPTLSLNGVFFEQDQGYALINNQILRIEDTIQGAKVEEITLGKVVLEFEGRKITLLNSPRDKL